MGWTFGGVAFRWVAQEQSGMPTRPTWSRKPRLAERPLLGTGNADVVLTGYEPWKMSGELIATATNAALLSALSGTAGSLTDGSTSWYAVAVFEVADFDDSSEGSILAAEFTRTIGGVGD